MKRGRGGDPEARGFRRMLSRPVFSMPLGIMGMVVFIRRSAGDPQKAGDKASWFDRRRSSGELADGDADAANETVYPGPAAGNGAVAGGRLGGRPSAQGRGAGDRRERLRHAAKARQSQARRARHGRHARPARLFGRPGARRRRQKTPAGDRRLHRRGQGCRRGAGLLFRPRRRGGRHGLFGPDRYQPELARSGGPEPRAGERHAGRAGQDRAGDDRAARCLPDQFLPRRAIGAIAGCFLAGRGGAGGARGAARADAGGQAERAAEHAGHGHRLCRLAGRAGARRRSRRQLALRGGAAQAFCRRRLFVRRSDDAGQRRGLSQDQGAAVAVDQFVAAPGAELRQAGRADERRRCRHPQRTAAIAADHRPRRPRTRSAMSRRSPTTKACRSTRSTAC